VIIILNRTTNFLGTMSRFTIWTTSFCLLSFFFLRSQGTYTFAQEVTQHLKPKIVAARAVDNHTIQIQLDGGIDDIDKNDIELRGDTEIKRLQHDPPYLLLTTSKLNIRNDYFVKIEGRGELPVNLGSLLDRFQSKKPLGFSVESGKTVFRLFVPRAHAVTLVLFDRHDDRRGQEHAMHPHPDGVWEVALNGTHWGKYYGYRIDGPKAAFEKYAPDKVIADPYSIAVCSKNNYHHEAKSLILDTDGYAWDGDQPLNIPWEDLIIYELHVRDMTAHPSSGVRQKGTYLGLIEKDGRGGLHHIKELGVNAVELLPIHEFGNMELPYNVEVNGVKNTWNPYERNHWGYMTSYFFAPESYYASGGNMTLGEYNGIHGQQVEEFKDLVKAFHREGIAVILDVVYNHVSQYDLNPFKYIDKQYYFHLDAEMDFLSFSGCGNDFKTDRAMARRIIVDSVTFWMTEYHVDGFRFDLAAMLDWETIEAITEAARKINPHVILIAEPWGGGKYDLGGFSERGWAAWNDLIRNGVKGQNPEDGLGWIFAHYWNDNNADKMKSYIRGSTREYGGPFVQKKHSVNYLESHDDHTLGDFIRIGSGEVDPKEKIRDLTANAKLSVVQMQLNKLAAAFLFTSQGPVMIHEGQEFARSKVIAETSVPDAKVGYIDHNSYNKDDATNHLNYDHKILNRELFDYYSGLTAMRRQHPAFRNMPADSIRFLDNHVDFSIGFLLPKSASGDSHTFAVLLNANPNRSARFDLPAGHWRRVVDGRQAGTTPFGKPIKRRVTVPPRSALILKELSED